MYIINLLLFEMVVILYASYLNVAYMSKKRAALHSLRRGFKLMVK